MIRRAWKAFLALFSEPPRVQPKPPRVIHDYTRRSWGHSYEVMVVDGPHLRIAGFGPLGVDMLFLDPQRRVPWIEEGDGFKVEGQRAPVLVYRVLSVEYQRDPRDMFFASLLLDEQLTRTAWQEIGFKEEETHHDA